VGNPSYDGVLWTMEKEFFGSFFLFAFLALLGHRKSRFIAYPVLTIICPLLGYVWLDAFLAGIAICDLTSVHESWWKSLEARSLAGVTRTMRESVWFAWLAWIPLLIAISLAPLLWRVTTKYGDVPSLIVGTIAVALTLFSLPTQRFFASAIPAYLGRISFSLYLVHIPLLCSFSRWLYWALLNNKIASHSMVAFLVCVATIAVSVAVSELLTRAVDEPSVQIARRISGFLIAKVNGLGAQDASPHLLPVAHGQSVSHSLESATLNS
jgi:peptidoglycan/LPS O-acetylase OafA/YrhL